jgi:hypothetical protein
LQEPQLTAQFSAQNLKVQGSEWSTAKFGVRASSSQIAVRDAVLESAHQGKAVLNANLALQEWSYHPSSPATASLSVQRDGDR